MAITDEKWVSVSERVPSHGGLVLVYYNCGSYDVDFFQDGKWQGDCDGVKVTHWMPLPESP